MAGTTTFLVNLDVARTTVTIADDDTRGVELTPTTLTVPEGGDSTYTVVLESEPTRTVTVTPSVGDNSDVTVSPSPLTFTPADWGDARTVTVSAGHDVDAEPDTATVIHAVSGADYGSVSADDVAVTVADDDKSASTAVELTVSIEKVEEGAGATSVTVTGTLNGAPRLSATSVTVSVGVTGDAATQGTDYATVLDFPLTIDAGQASGTATFTLTPVGDDLDEEDEALTVAGTTMVPNLRRDRDDGDDCRRRHPWGGGDPDLVDGARGGRFDLHGGAGVRADGDGDGEAVGERKFGRDGEPVASGLHAV